MADITSIAFEQRYDDDSGAELRVSWDAFHDGGRVMILAVDSLLIEPEKLEWLIDSLVEVRRVIGRYTPSQAPR
jgi:hypothetical protein